MTDRKQLEALLLGTAVGDAIGLPYEGLSPQRAERLLKPPLRHRLFLGRGMCSDDTEHACMTAQAILSSHGDADSFSRSLAWRLRGWLLGLPAGIGLATLKSIVKLWLGFPPSRSGAWSAGNGPAMRAPVIGACFGDQPELLTRFVRASTLMTHRDPRALNGSLLVARAAWLAATSECKSLELLAKLRSECDTSDLELEHLLDRMTQHLAAGTSLHDFAMSLGLQRGVSGYIYHTVPVALYAWLIHRTQFRCAIEEVIALGGDTDTTAAITGALCGAEGGVESIPQEWIDGMIEIPRSIGWMRKLAGNLAELPSQTLPIAWWSLPFRNLFFAVVVILHGFRRLLPPY